MMKRSALLLFFIVLAGSALGDIEKRVMNAPNCKKDQGLHHVALTVLDKKGQPSEDLHCGGSLIGKEWVITAAHCDKKKLVTLLGTHPSNLDIRGDIIDKQQYKNNDGPHDIMLLKVRYQQPKPALTTIKLPKYPKCRTPAEGTHAEVFGRFTANLIPQNSQLLKGNSTQLPILQCGKMKIAKCGTTKDHQNISLRHFYYDWNVCAMNQKKHVDCWKGDSGGSLVVKKILYGVVSSGRKKFCGGPVNFMDVCRYRKWIHEVTGL